MVKNLRRNKNRVSKIADIVEQSYLGKIMDVDDAKHEGRCRIRVFGVFGGEDDTQLENIPTADLPWAYPLLPAIFGKNGSGSFHTPKKNSIVRVFFDGDQYHPYYYSISELDADLKAKISADYKNFHGILFDEEEKLRIWYSQKTGLLINLDDSIINIKPNNSILIDHKTSSSTIELAGPNCTITTNANVDVSSKNNITLNSNQVHANGTITRIGANPIFSAVNGEPLMLLFKAMATVLDAKLATTNGLAVGLVQQFEAAILSKTVTTTP